MHGFPRGPRRPGATAVAAVATTGADFADRFTDHFPDRFIDRFPDRAER